MNNERKFWPCGKENMLLTVLTCRERRLKQMGRGQRRAFYTIPLLIATHFGFHRSTKAEEASDMCCSGGSYLTIDKESKFTATNILSVLGPLRVPDPAACPHRPGWALARKGSLPLVPCNTVR